MILVHYSCIMARVSVQVPTWYKNWGLHCVQCGLGTTALEAAPCVVCIRWVSMQGHEKADQGHAMG